LGKNTDAAPGVLKQLSQKYPAITFKISSAGSDKVITLINGKVQ
jgi:hypothetical protein